MALILGIVLSGNGCAGDRTEPEPQQTTETPNIETTGRTDFAFDLYRAVVKDKPDENIAISPYGAEQVLDLARAGAVGETETEIGRVLAKTGVAGLNVLPPDAPLTTAVALWLQAGHPILPEFLTTAREEFGASVEHVDFFGNPDEAVQRINAWYSEQTKEKIPTLFDSLGETTRVVLAGAIHFAADWKTPFNKDATLDGSFTLQDGTKMTTKIMSRTGLMQYGETDDTLALQLPYKNDGYAMLLLLPRDAAGFTEWESAMTPEIWDDLRTAMKPEQVDLRMPRFTMESNFLLNEPLKQLGMPTAFSRDADFSKIDGLTDLYLSEVRQKVFVKVDETGTEAAAATGAVMAVKSMPINVRPFYADRPFLYAIVKEDTILFLGRFMKPDAATPETATPTVDPDLDGEGGAFN